MRFLKRTTVIMSVLLAICIVIPMLAPVAASASVPTRKTMRIGLNYNTTALASANLINNAGFDIGYYDSDLKFTKITSTNETALSVMVDRNLQWNGSAEFSGQYQLTGNNGLNGPSSGTRSVGFAHVKAGNAASYDAAFNIVAAQNGFVRYTPGAGADTYMALYGSYSSSSGVPSPNTGGSRTITVVAMNTAKILFEFDNTHNTSVMLGIKPKTDTATAYRGYSYLGGFRYDRREATKLTVVNIVNLEPYVMGVVPHEMSNSWGQYGLEALKAQAICARTYVLANLNKHNSYGFDLCNTADCQVYRGYNSTYNYSNSAVTATTGQVVTHNGSLISTYYSSSHGGGSENNENVWAGTALPYIRGVLDSYEDSISSSISQYNWTLQISQANITQRVKNAGYTGASTITSLQVTEYSPTGNVITVTATDSGGRQYKFSRRAGLQALFGGSNDLRSQRFNIGSTVWTPGGAIYVNSPAVQVNPSQYYAVTDTGSSLISGTMVALDGNNKTVNVQGNGAGVTAGAPTGPVNGNFTITGKGWGHSLGMSQWGAYSMARYHGKTAQEIITHYYTGVKITQT